MSNISQQRAGTQKVFGYVMAVKFLKHNVLAGTPHLKAPAGVALV